MDRVEFISSLVPAPSRVPIENEGEVSVRLGEVDLECRVFSRQYRNVIVSLTFPVQGGEAASRLIAEPPIDDDGPVRMNDFWIAVSGEDRLGCLPNIELRCGQRMAIL